MAQRITIVDATLEHVERSPGCGLNLDERLRMAHQLERLRPDTIEAGTPMTSPADFEAVRLIARTVEHTAVAARCRARRADIDRAWDAVQGAKHPRLHLFADVASPSQEGHSADDRVNDLREAVRYAVALCPAVSFSCEGATLADREFLMRLVASVAEAGASAVVLPDTTGAALPDEYAALVRSVVEGISGKNVSVRAAAYNDLGLATANVLAALGAGATGVECAINGIGPRSGVAALEELVRAIHARGNQFGWETGVVTEEIYKTSRLLSSLTGLPVPRNKPVVGANAFTHAEAGGQSGAERRSAHQVVDPHLIGIKHSTLVLGRHSEKGALGQRYKELGYDLPGEDLDRAFALFRQIVEQKREVLDEDLLAILEQQTQEPEEIYQLENIQVHSGTTLRPTATIELRKGNDRFVDSATGDGPVDAAYKAIERITGMSGQLTEYMIKSMSVGRDGFGEVFVRAEFDGVSFHGRGVSTDIITGSARAYLEALNRALGARKKRQQAKER